MIRAGKHVIGGIQLHPTEWWSKYSDPRVGCTPAHEGIGALGDLPDVSTHIPGGQAASPQTRDHEVRKVLAYAAAAFQYLDERRGNRGLARRIAEVLVQLGAQSLGTRQDRSAAGKTVRGIFIEERLDPDIRRFVFEFRRFEAVAGRIHPAVGQPGRRTLPRYAVRYVNSRARVDLDLHIGRHFELAMRMVKLDPRHEIAEGVDLVALAIEGRSHVDRVLQALLIRGWPRDEMQQLMRMHDVVTVLVGGLVPDAVADSARHVASA